MINLFESENYPDGVPDELDSGAFAAWKNVAITGAYPTASYTLLFEFYPLDGTEANSFRVTASKVSDAHVVAQRLFVEPGEYRWQALIQRDSDNVKLKVDEGFSTVRAEAGADVSHTYTVLTAIRATLEGTASREQSRIEIGGRVLEQRPITELLALEKEYTKRWQRERAAVERRAGRPAKSRVLVTMGA